MAASAALAGALAVPGMAAGQSQHNGAPTREDITRENAARPADRAPTRVTVEGDVEHAPCPLADPRYAQVMVTLDRVEFSGLEVVPAAALDSAWRGDVGAAVPVARLCEIRDRAATILRGLGYLAAVQIPPQRIDKGGTVHMDVLMARLTKVQVRGDPGNSSAIIERILRGVAGEGPAASCAVTASLSSRISSSIVCGRSDGAGSAARAGRRVRAATALSPSSAIIRLMEDRMSSIDGSALTSPIAIPRTPAYLLGLSAFAGLGASVSTVPSIGAPSTGSRTVSTVAFCALLPVVLVA